MSPFNRSLLLLRLKLLILAPFFSLEKKSDSISSSPRHVFRRSKFLIPDRSCNRRTKILLGSLTLTFIIATVVLFTLFFAPFYKRVAVASPINTDTFTLLISSYGPRLPLLRGAIKHYSSCPSISSILVVWNGLKSPNISSSSRIPLRIRMEKQKSLNNRFKPDPNITTRAVLSMDDDIRIPCIDIEQAFALHKSGRHELVGFFPRLIEGSPDLKFRGESYAIQRTQYNVVLTGAAFLNHGTAFPAYWREEIRHARAVVDEVFNGEDILMNFVLCANMSNMLKNGIGIHDDGRMMALPVKFFQPSRRIDVSKLSRVGISHDMKTFLAATEKVSCSIYH